MDFSYCYILYIDQGHCKFIWYAARHIYIWALFTDHIRLCHFSFIWRLWSPPHQQFCSCVLLELNCGAISIFQFLHFPSLWNQLHSLQLSDNSDNYPSYNYNVWLKVATKCDLLFCIIQIMFGIFSIIAEMRFLDALVLAYTSMNCSQPKQSNQYIFDIWFTACDNNGVVSCLLTFFVFWNLVLTQSMLKLAVFAVVELWLWQIHRRALVDVLEWGLGTGLQHRCLPQCWSAITSSSSIFGKWAKPCCVSQVEFKALISLLPVHIVVEKRALNHTACEEATGVFSALHLRSIYEINLWSPTSLQSELFIECSYCGEQKNETFKANINRLDIIFESLFFGNYIRIKWN